MMVGIQIERGYVSATVAAGLLGVSRQRINQLLKAGRFDGAFLMDVGDGREMWCIPRKAIHSRPMGRKKKVRAYVTSN
jgi:hypothetical protein